MQFLITSVISLAVTLASAFGIYNYLPLSVLEYTQTTKSLGSTITTIAGSDTISGSRSVINTNFSNLNTDKAEIASTNQFTVLQKFTNASTSLFSCYGLCYFGATATSSFSTAGALTLITPLTVANGGTGSTTLSSNQVLLGNGTGNIGLVAGYGTTGQFLTSNGSASAPTWQTSAVDTAINYNWTANHNFTGSTTVKDFSASSTAAWPIKLNSLSYAFPPAHGASSTALITNGGGSLIWGTPTPTRYIYSTSTAVTTAAGGSVTSSFLTIPAGVMNASSTITVDAQISKCLMPGGATGSCTIEVQDGAATAFVSAAAGFSSAVSLDSKYGTFHAVIYNNSSVSSQTSLATSFCVDPGATDEVNAGCAGGSGTSAINTAAATTIAIKITADTGIIATLDKYVIVVEP